MRPPKFSAPIRTMGKSICLMGCCALLLPVLAELFRCFASAREKARQTSCNQNMRDISSALALYCQDWDATLPPARQWADAATLHLKPKEMPQIFHCLTARTPHTYVFNV